MDITDWQVSSRKPQPFCLRQGKVDPLPVTTGATRGGIMWEKGARPIGLVGTMASANTGKKENCVN